GLAHHANPAAGEPCALRPRAVHGHDRGRHVRRVLPPLTAAGDRRSDGRDTSVTRRGTSPGRVPRRRPGLPRRSFVIAAYARPPAGPSLAPESSRAMRFPDLATIMAASQ